MTFAAVNTYTGATAVTTGTLLVSNASALGTTADGTMVTSGAALDVRVNIGTEGITVGGTGVIFTSGVASGSFSGGDGGGKTASLGGSAGVPEPVGLLLVGALGMLNRRRRQHTPPARGCKPRLLFSCRPPQSPSSTFQ